jgi:hypothetical protein
MLSFTGLVRSVAAFAPEHNTNAFRDRNIAPPAFSATVGLKLTRIAAGLIRPVAGLGLRSPPLLQLLNPLLKALHHEREPLVTELMGVAETR